MQKNASTIFLFIHVICYACLSHRMFIEAFVDVLSLCEFKLMQRLQCNFKEILITYISKCHAQRGLFSDLDYKILQ